MSDWNPSLYLHFSAERSRPAVELLARVPLENVEYVAD
ncbi:TPA: trans-aconitate 2-methyltransferase, partial [Escherichia coli]|nr:trans-aconitate 2-methyltransferase [Escherichia coli]